MKNKKFNNSNTKEYIFGRNPIKEAMRSNRLKSVYISDGFSDFSLIEELKKNKISIQKVSNNELNNFAPGNHQGIIGEVAPYNFASVEEIIHLSRNKERPIIVILDGIEDPHNLGAILRSCDVFGVSGVIVKKYNQAPMNAVVAKTSAGAINYVKVAQVTNLNNTIEKLKDEGYWVVATDGSAKLDYNKIDYNFKVALIIGSEGKGISSLLLKNSDYIVKIPMKGKVNSLNASVAAGVLLAQISNN